MKAWTLIIVAVLFTTAVVIYLFERGFITEGFDWQNITILVAALFAPAKMIFIWIQEQAQKTETKENLIAENQQLKQDLQKSITLNQSLTKVEQEAQRLEKEIELINAQMRLLDSKKK